MVAKNHIYNHRVELNKNKPFATIKGTVYKYDTVNYKLGANNGQHMQVVIETKKAFMNIITPKHEIIFNGITDGNSYYGELPEKGNYTIQIRLKENEKKYETMAEFTLKINIDEN